MTHVKKGIRVFALLWLLAISILFFLPGSALPDEGLFNLPYFDKYVHFGLFAVLLFLWRFFFDGAAKFTWILLGLAFCYGLAVEVIQHYWVANRSFDMLDVAADMLGAAAGLIVWTSRYIKNRPL
jgi:VanZ family protein